MPSKHDYHYQETIEMLDIFKDLDYKYRYVRTHLTFCSVGCDEKLVQYRNDIKRIKEALGSISPIHAYIITQTFRSDGEPNNKWWKGIYSKSTFYRMRSRAMKSFLEVYE